MIFECRRNQPVSTAISSPNSFRDITTIRTHQNLGKILKDIFFVFVKTVWHVDRHSTQPNIILFAICISFHSYTQELVCMFSCNKFFLFIINLRILSFSQVGFSLRPIQVLKHLGLPQLCLLHPPNNTTILLPTLIRKESASLNILLILSSKLNSNKFILLIISLSILS